MFLRYHYPLSITYDRNAFDKLKYPDDARSQPGDSPKRVVKGGQWTETGDLSDPLQSARPYAWDRWGNLEDRGGGHIKGDRCPYRHCRIPRQCYFQSHLTGDVYLCQWPFSPSKPTISQLQCISTVWRTCSNQMRYSSSPMSIRFSFSNAVRQ
jgi:hypothetical protein